MALAPAHKMPDQGHPCSLEAQAAVRQPRAGHGRPPCPEGAWLPDPADQGCCASAAPFWLSWCWDGLRLTCARRAQHHWATPACPAFLLAEHGHLATPGSDGSHGPSCEDQEQRQQPWPPGTLSALCDFTWLHKVPAWPVQCLDLPCRSPFTDQSVCLWSMSSPGT